MKNNLRNARSAITALIIFFFLIPNANFAQAPSLGSASSFALFTSDGAFNNSGASTVVTGDVGNHTGAFNAFPPGILVGSQHVGDPASVSAASDVANAYSSLSAVNCGPVLSITMGGGQVLLPNVYCLGAASTIGGDLTLDGQGDPTSIFIFKINGALATDVNSHIILTNSASLCNVYWQVNGEVDLGKNSLFQGTILANGAINLLEGATLLGRGLSQAGAISLHNNVVTTGSPSAVSTITASGATTFCAGGSVTLSGNAGGVWSNGETGGSISVTAPGDYFVTSTNTDCNSEISNTITVTVNPLPTVTPGSYGPVCSSSGPITLGGTPSGGIWTGTGVSGSAGSYIFNPGAGTQTLTYTYTDGTTTCSNSAQTTITVNTESSVTAGSYGPVCTNSSLVALAGTPPGGTWTGTGVSGSAGSYTFNPAVGTQTLTYTYTNGACSNSAPTTITVNPALIVTAGSYGPVCGNSGLITLTGTPSGGIWTGTGVSGAPGSYTFNPAAGTQTLTYTYTNGTCSNSAQTTITVNTAATVTAGTYGSVCINSAPVILKGTPSGGVWTGTGVSGSAGNYTFNPASGTQTLTYTYTTGTCSNSSPVIITVNPALIVTAGAYGPVCGSSGLITLGGSPSGGIWTGTGVSGTTGNYKFNPGVGTQTLTYTYTNGACSNNAQVSITVNATPAATTGSAAFICAGNSVTLGAASITGHTYKWTPVTGLSSATIANPVASPSATTTYILTETITASGCQKTNSVIVTVSPSPNCTITGNSTVCTGGSIQLSVPTGGATYKWNTGATSNSIVVTTAGIYTVTVTNASGCSSTCSKTITAGGTAPSCAITGNSSICVGGSIQLSAPAGCATYKWSTGATTSSITVTAPGTYSITVTNAGGCSSTCSKTITTGGTAPSCAITGNSSICVGGSIQLSAPAGCATYKWSTGATTSSITVTAPGTYSITVTNAGGCSSTCSKTITTGGTAPSCAITGNSSICTGGSIQLSAPAGCATYKWSTGATSSSIMVTAPGTYSITVTNAGGCSSTCSKTITTGGTAPSCAITGNSSICTGGSTQLSAPAGCATYKWSTGATTSSIIVTAPGTYSITVTNAGGCSSTCSKTITTGGTAPSCTITGNSSICVGGSTQLSAPAGCASYKWSTGATTSSITVTAAGTYSITVTNAGGCSSTCSKTITTGPPSCTITGNLHPNQGQTTSLCAPAGCSSYKWSTGATTSTITVNCSGTYTVTVKNSGGCSSSGNACVTYTSSLSSSFAADKIKISAIDKNFKVSAYPNPFTSKATIEFQNNESGSHVVIELYNMTGNKMATLFDGDVKKGILYKTDLNRQNLPSGIYTYRILTGDKVINKKVILQ